MMGVGADKNCRCLALWVLARSLRIKKHDNQINVLFGCGDFFKQTTLTKGALFLVLPFSSKQNRCY